MRQLFGIFTSLVTAGLIIVMAQMISEGLFPPPSSLDFTNKAAMTLWMNELPDQAYMIVAISHGIGIFAAGLISSLVAGSTRMTIGMITISIIFIIVMIFLFTYHFPVWFVVTDTVVTAILGFVGVLVGSTRYVN